MRSGAVSLQQLLESAADRSNPIHDAQFTLDYDAIGQVVALTQR
jgi:hypothetical protein